MPDSSKKCIIFESCDQFFPSLVKGLNASEGHELDLQLIALSEGNCDLKLKNIDKVPLKGQFRVQLFSEFELNKVIKKHPSFILNLDVNTRRAEVLSFESHLNPHIRLDSYSVINGIRYKNIVASKDLETLCLTWIKQLNELNYYTRWERQEETA